MFFFEDALNYNERKVARINPEDNNGVGVSTAFTSDEGYETALLDAVGVHPVERYKTREQAVEGHKRWAEWAGNTDNKQVRKLGGLWGTVPDSIITLNRDLKGGGE